MAAFLEQGNATQSNMENKMNKIETNVMKKIQDVDFYTKARMEDIELKNEQFIELSKEKLAAIKDRTDQMEFAEIHYKFVEEKVEALKEELTKVIK